ncbi:uncharacterized protein [Physcomitrium patens]|uniref:C2H2-type domain-containing protein n=1 Tax=Physcomitrium patens TaxID=3218 RepID=A0A2K1IF90_PHYPA|nr:uncharacterized protein LOC112277014 [Physcomitrium patens]PNR27949.1 hypothetical protein PHYPA_028541 [Physcomitrium patens]|eukprot:XP_024364710.1 uncharacterized protein LOC112277014 [Physcomitrella patens]
MPGPCFSWAKSISFKAKSISFKSDSGSDISHESRFGSFSSTPLRGDHPKSPSRSNGCSQGCTPSIANLKEMLQGNSTLLGSRSVSHPSTCESLPKDEVVVHKTKNADSLHRAPLKTKPTRSFLKQYSISNVQEATRTSKELVNTVAKSKDNLCFVKGCSECSMHCNSGEGGIVIRDTHHHDALSPKCVYPKCGEAFSKPEALEMHQVVRHAVSELGRGNPSLNVIEIIFKTSWSVEAPCVRIERILKIDNTDRHISEFQSYRDAVKKSASDEGMQHERCLADGNELLRFYGSSFVCSLGTNGSTALCSMASCNVCSIIRWGFAVRNERGIFTTATSGKAHEIITAREKENWRGKHAMLVCRVIAGRICKTLDKASRFIDASCLPDGYDSVSPGMATNLDELTVFNPKAVLPCFLVVYSF